ncbi:MAG: UDP-N-acetylglucosamine O-acyltransferase [Phycisphaerae bacterium]
MPQISPHAIVEKGATLADDVRIGPFSYVGPNVRIGAGCVIENNATVTGRTTLSEGNHVYPLAVIGESSDDSEEDGECIIGTANTLREHVTVYAGQDEPTRIGDDNLLMIDCQVGPAAVIGDHCIFANYTHVREGARVEDYVRTSGFCLINPGVTVGSYTFSAGYVIVDQDAPPFAIIQGSPYRVRGVNTHNLRRCGFGEDDIRCLKDAFRELYNGQTRRPDDAAIARLRDSDADSAGVRRLVEFISEHSAGGESAHV